MEVKIKLLNNNAKLPTRGSEDAAGYDLYAAIDHPIIIPAHETRKISTGIAVEIPKGYFGGIFARSGIATKRGLRPANVPGCIDADYRGEIIVALHNDSNVLQTIEPGERIAQMVVVPYLIYSWSIVKELDETDRADSGFGDSGRF